MAMLVEQLAESHGESPLRLHGNYLLIYKTDIDNPANAATMKLVAAKAG